MKAEFDKLRERTLTVWCHISKYVGRGLVARLAPNGQHPGFKDVKCVIVRRITWTRGIDGVRRDAKMNFLEQNFSCLQSLNSCSFEVPKTSCIHTHFLKFMWSFNFFFFFFANLMQQLGRRGV